MTTAMTPLVRLLVIAFAAVLIVKLALIVGAVFEDATESKP